MIPEMRKWRQIDIAPLFGHLWSRSTNCLALQAPPTSLWRYSLATPYHRRRWGGRLHSWTCCPDNLPWKGSESGKTFPKVFVLQTQWQSGALFSHLACNQLGFDCDTGLMMKIISPQFTRESWCNRISYPDYSEFLTLFTFTVRPWLESVSQFPANDRYEIWVTWVSCTAGARLGRFHPQASLQNIFCPNFLTWYRRNHIYTERFSCRRRVNNFNDSVHCYICGLVEYL